MVTEELSLFILVSLVSPDTWNITWCSWMLSTENNENKALEGQKPT